MNKNFVVSLFDLKKQNRIYSISRKNFLKVFFLNMENFLNYQCNGEGWSQQCLSASSFGGEVVPVAKQRCQANARERDRTQKLVQKPIFSVD